MPTGNEGEQVIQGGQVQPGSGYVPPGGGVAFNALSTGSSGAAVVTPLALMALAWSTNTAGGEYSMVKGGGTPYNLPLVASLMLAAVVFAALALLLTALANRYGETYKVSTPKELLWSYAILTLLGLAVDGLALDFLARRAFASFHLAALVGTLLELLAFAVGVYSLLPHWKRDLKTPDSTRGREAART